MLYMDASLPPPATPTPCACVPIDPKGYCWSRGYCVRTVHNSRTCNITLPGYQKDTTHNKPMDSSTKNKPEWDPEEDTKVEGKNYKKLVTKQNKCLPFPTVSSSVLAVSDSGTTGHYITTGAPCENKTKANHPIPITLPNVDIISSTRSCHRQIYRMQLDMPTSSRTSPRRSYQLGRSATTTALQSLTPTRSPSMTNTPTKQ